MKKEFIEPEVEVVEFEVCETISLSGDPENPVEPGEGWWD